MRTLLLADDSITVQRVITLTFADEQIRVVTVADGRQAMERMAAQKPDIVLAGTTLPHVNGYDLARFIRNKPELRGVPVLLLSGAFETVDEARLASSGANGVLEKPVEPTVVIGRVKELLGLKADGRPPAAARPAAPADAPTEKRLPVATPPRAVTSTRGTPSRWEQLRDQTGLEANTRSVEDSSTRSDDYLDTLDAAFDSLDQQLSGRAPAAKPQRNPSGPLGQSAGAPDPRSPGRRPPASAAPAGNPVFDVDDEWFGSGDSPARADARAGRREIDDDLRDAPLSAPRATEPATPIYEVDDNWFAERERARAAQIVEQQQLAAEMGIRDVGLPEKLAAASAALPAKDDFDFALADITPAVAEPPAPAPLPAPAAPKAIVAEPPQPPEPPKPAAIAPLPAAFAREQPPRPAVPVSASASPRAPSPASVGGTSGRDGGPAPHPYVADDFAALLAFEQGEREEPPMPPPPEIKVVTPEITDEMLEQIATRVADRLTTSTFADHVRNALTTTMRETVHDAVSATVPPIVFETSERVVRDVVAETSERVIRDVVGETSARVVREVVAETSERVVREVAAATTERVVREVVTATSERVTREVVAEVSERVIRDVVGETSARVVREVVAETSARVVREVVAATSERAAREAVAEVAERVIRDVVGETSARVVREVVADTCERVVRETVAVASERVMRDVVPAAADRAVREAVSETTASVVRDVVPAVTERAVREAISRATEQAVRDAVSQATGRVVQDVVSETSERLVREEIDRIKSRTRT